MFAVMSVCTSPCKTYFLHPSLSSTLAKGVRPSLQWHHLSQAGPEQAEGRRMRGPLASQRVWLSWDRAAWEALSNFHSFYQQFCHRCCCHSPLSSCGNWGHIVPCLQLFPSIQIHLYNCSPSPEKVFSLWSKRGWYVCGGGGCFSVVD